MCLSAISNAFSERMFCSFVLNLSALKSILSRKIAYHDFRKFCGRTFGIKKTEANVILNSLSDSKIVELSSSGFVVMDKKYFMN